MRANLKYIIIAGVAFIFAITASSVIGAFVNVLIPNPNKSDPDGKIEPDPQEKSKAEWLQQLEGGGPTETKETKAETKVDPNPEPATPAENAPAPAPEPTPTFVAPPVPAPRVGPGDFDAPVPFTPPPVIRTGPGNM